MNDTQKRFNRIPSPFTLAIFLAFFTMVLALVFTGKDMPLWSGVRNVFAFFGRGFWELLNFAMQMVIMLVLGSMLARTAPFHAAIRLLTSRVSTMPAAAAILAFFAVLLSYLNWGLGLIFGALLARSMAVELSRRGIKISYPLLGAAAYSGLMVWHGGLSGSAPLKVAQQGHFLEDKMGVLPVTQTIFSTMNISLFFAAVLLIPLFFYLMALKAPRKLYTFSNRPTASQPAFRLTLSSPGLLFGLFLLVTALVLFIYEHAGLNINTINLLLFALNLLLYGRVDAFTRSATGALSSTTGIILQFPVYAGIMGVIKYSGLSLLFTHAVIALSSPHSFPLFTLFSAAVVNVFVPSGGGQWAVQGPLIVDAAQQMHVPMAKALMALCYGDQLTNMIQPFWALPLLSITGLKAESVLRFSLPLMLLGFLIFGIGLLL